MASKKGIVGTAWGADCPSCGQERYAHIIHPDLEHILELLCPDCGSFWALESPFSPLISVRRGTGMEKA